MCDCRVVANRNAFDAMLCELLIASRAIGNVFLLECVPECRVVAICNAFAGMPFELLNAKLSLCGMLASFFASICNAFAVMLCERVIAALLLLLLRKHGKTDRRTLPDKLAEHGYALTCDTGVRYM